MFFCWRSALDYVDWHIVLSYCDLRRLLTHLARPIGTVDFLVSLSLLSDIHASHMPLFLFSSINASAFPSRKCAARAEPRVVFIYRILG